MNMKIAAFACTPVINIYLYVLTTKHFKKLFYLLWDVKVVALGRGKLEILNRLLCI